MKRSILFIMMLIMTLPAFAQKVSIYGVVSDMEDGSPIVGAAVISKDKNGNAITGATTDIKGEYIITIEETGEEIGECSLTQQSDSAEIGFMLFPKYWLQGYGTEVVTSLIEIARDMKLKELTATTDARNKAAIRLLEKCGFKKQKHGWMVVIPEGEESKVSGGQNIIQFQRGL